MITLQTFMLMTNLHMICSILVARQEMKAIEPPRKRKITFNISVKNHQYQAVEPQ